MSSHQNYNHTTHHYHQDPELARQMRRQADCHEERLELERQRFEHEQQVQRAQDLGITHAEFLRRRADVDQAQLELAKVLEEERHAQDRVDRALLEIRNQASIERWGLYWRNRWNWMKHPILTRKSIVPFARAIESRIAAGYQPLHQAQQDLRTIAPRVQVAGKKVSLYESRI